MQRSRFPRPFHLALRAVLGCALALASGFVGISPTSVSASSTLHVTDCTDAGANSLRGKIGAAAPGDTIVFDRDCAGPSAIVLATGTLTIATNNLTIDGTGHSIVVDGGCTFSGGTCMAGGTTVFAVQSGVTASLNALTIQHGNAPGDGGGIFNEGTLTLTNSTATENAPEGIMNLRGTMTVVSSTSSGNAYGVANDAGVLTVTNSTITGNSSGSSGGGIINLTTGNRHNGRHGHHARRW